MNENLLPSGRSRWWICFLLGRMVAYGLLGGLACAVVGALLVAGAGYLTGRIQNYPGRYNRDIPIIGAYIGVALGGVGGGLMGVVMLGIASFFEPPGRRLLPPRHILVPTFQGMTLATIGIMTTFLVLIGVATQAQIFPVYGVIGGVRTSAFSQTLGHFLFAIMFGVPGVMMCGGVLGAICGMRRKKETNPKDLRTREKLPKWSWE